MFPFVRPLNIHPPTGATGATGASGCFQACTLEWNGSFWNQIGLEVCPNDCYCSVEGAPESPGMYETFESSCVEVPP